MSVEIPYKKGRVEGTFTVHAQTDGRARAEFKGTVGGKDHHGSIHFRARGKTEDGVYLYAHRLDNPTRAASAAIVEAAQRVVLAWAPANDDTFAEIDRDYAGSQYRARQEDVAELREKLAAAERAVEAARVHFLSLGGPL